MEKVSLTEVLKKAPGYDHAVVCTYRFGATTFENAILNDFRAFRGCAVISVLTDAADFARLCDEADLRYVNHRYLLQDVTVGSRVFHPKLMLFTSGSAARLVVGSANFTESGLGENAELVQVFEAQKIDGRSPRIFHVALDILEAIAMRWLPADGAFSGHLATVRANTDWLFQAVPEDDHSPALVHNLDRPLLDSFEEALGAGPVEEFITLCPYFDANLDALSEIARRFDPRVIRLITRDRDTTLPVDRLAGWRSAHPNTELKIQLLEYANGEDAGRMLHAKFHAARRGEVVVCMSGSPNCTASALLRKAGPGNFETGLLVKDARRREVSALINAMGRLVVPADETRIVRAPLQPTWVSSPTYVALSRVEWREPYLTLDYSPLWNGGLRVALSTEPPVSISVAANQAPLKIMLPEAAREALRKGAVRARLVSEEGEPLSGWRWIENARAGDLPHRFRPNWEASQRDPGKFFLVLKDLVDRGEIAAIIDFLQWMNIPTEGLHRNTRGRRYMEAMRGFSGIPPLLARKVETLRTAMDEFYPKHRRKLESHARTPNMDGIDNFVQIFETLAMALRCQWDHELTNISSADSQIPADAWADFRQYAGICVQRYFELLPILQRFVSGLHAGRGSGNYRPESDLEETLLGGHAMWLNDVALGIQKLISNARVCTQGGQLVPLPFGTHDELEHGNLREARSAADRIIASALNGLLRFVGEVPMRRAI